MTKEEKLTPEILEHHFGFDNLGGDFQKGIFSLYAGHHEFWYWADGRNDKVETVGDLQILYKEITGSELQSQTNNLKQ